MTRKSPFLFRQNAFCLIIFSLILGASTVALGAELPGLTVTGIQRNANGTTTEVAVTRYRWLVEEDRTYHVAFDAAGQPVLNPGQPGFDASWENTLSVSFHKSYMPLKGKGCVGFADVANPGFVCSDVTPILEPNKFYYVSVLPRTGYTIGGTAFRTDGAGTPFRDLNFNGAMDANGSDGIPGTADDENRLIAYVHQTPLPTAQISIFVFADMQPINGIPDLPSEDPATNGSNMSGFKINIEDAGGRYGASAGMMSTDVYGNPLGTTYKPGCDPYEPTCVDVVGGGIFTGPDGYAHIYNVAQGKYGITVVPPPGTDWIQTSTIEGTKVIDAWVKPNEPPFFAEFGPPGPHAFFGFTRNFNAIRAGGTTTLSGTVVNMHMSRPPDYAFYNGTCFGHTTPWVALNDLAVGLGTGVYAAPTNANCGFSIPNVPDGNYQLVIFDNNLDLIIAAKGISIANGACNTINGSCNLGEVPVFQWFTRQEHWVFNDINGDGVWDDNEDPLPEVPLNIRWRDGSVYQTNVTDGEGAYAFDQVFPFFSWQVAEVGFTRLQATGVTVVVDNGGPVDAADPWGGGVLNPQDQTNPGTGPGLEYATHRVETGPTLLQPFQGFIGQTSAFQWGKRHYPDGENGGISGIVFYDVTRDVNNPEAAAGQVWEPGIPGVTVNLFDRTGAVLLNSTKTDSWDDNIPTGCKWGNEATAGFTFSPDGVNFYPRDCYDGLRNFNQVRPGVFDGGYAFDSICPGGLAADGSCAAWTSPMPVGDYIVEVVPLPGYEITKWEDKNVDFGDSYKPPTPALLPPPCVGPDTPVPPYLSLYPDEQIEVVGWNTGMTRPLCNKKKVTVGAGTNSAADFFLHTEVPVASHGIGFILDDTQNEFDPNAPNFGEKYAPPFMPVAIRDWTGREIGRTYSDQYGVYNFLAPSTSTSNVPAPSGMSPHMLTACMNDATRPDGSLDPHHNPIYSQFCYTLQYMPGVYTYLDTPVVPVGAFAGADQFPVDCEFPDKTPRIREVTVTTNAVGGGPYIPVDPTTLTITAAQTIKISSMGLVGVPDPTYCNNVAGNCPAGSNTTNKLISRDYGFGPSGTVTLGNLGTLSCAWGDPITCTIPAGTNISTLGGIGGRQLMVTRSDGGTSKTGITVQVGLRPGSSAVPVWPDATGNPLASPLQTAIDAARRNDLLLVHPGVYNEMVVMWKPVQLQGFGEGSTMINALKQPADKLTTWRGKVQNLIQTGRVALLPGQEAAFGGIEQVALMTEEGAGVLVLSSASGNTRFDQNNNRGARIDGFTITGADTGGGVVVNGYGHYAEISNNRVVNNSGTYSGGIRVGHPILTNTLNGLPEYTDGQNDFVKIHNNQVKQNGALDGAGAGISMCTGSDSYQVTQNWVCGNFSTQEGGGIGHIGRSNGRWITVPDSGPQSSRVWTLTDIPLIEDNTIIFNEVFNAGLTVAGGGLFIGGAPAFGCPLLPNGQPDPLCLADPTRTLSPGAGNVVVNANLIQGNGAGSGDAGGIRLAMVNGQDVAANRTNANKRNGNTGASDPAPWFKVDLFNNIVVNNVAGLAGGGISLQDSAKVNIIHNTIANNYSLGTAGEAFTSGPNQSVAQPGAGIATRRHSSQLAGLSGTTGLGTFSDPQLENTIAWHNQKYFFFVDTASNCVPGDTQCTSTFGLCPAPPGAVSYPLNCPAIPGYQIYDDLAVVGQQEAVLACDSNSCITSAGQDPLFVLPYLNGARSSVLQAEATTIQTPAAFDEGGNFIRPNYGPLTLIADPANDPLQLLTDYHIQSGSPAINTGINRNSISPIKLAEDVDGALRPQGTQVDIGADENE